MEKSIQSWDYLYLNPQSLAVEDSALNEIYCTPKIFLKSSESTYDKV
jgi:hypothetical protein